MNGERPAKRSRRLAGSSASSASETTSNCSRVISTVTNELGAELAEVKEALEETAHLVGETGEEVVDSLVHRLEEQDESTRYAIDDGASKIACMLEEKLDTTNEMLRSISSALGQLTESINMVRETMRMR